MVPNVPTTYRDALRGIVDRDFMKVPKYTSQQWTAIRSGVDPQILTLERLLVRRMGRLGVPMFCVEGLRSSSRQEELKKKGFSKLSSGPHMVGMAVDIVHGTRAWDIPRLAWDLVGHVGKEIIAQEGLSITWGGDWKDPWDPAHWERTGWRNVATSGIMPF